MIVIMSTGSGGHVAEKIARFEVKFRWKPISQTGKHPELVEGFSVNSRFVADIQQYFLLRARVGPFRKNLLFPKWQNIPEQITQSERKRTSLRFNTIIFNHWVAYKTLLQKRTMQRIQQVKQGMPDKQLLPDLMFGEISAQLANFHSWSNIIVASESSYRLIQLIADAWFYHSGLHVAPMIRRPKHKIKLQRPIAFELNRVYITRPSSKTWFCLRYRNHRGKEKQNKQRRSCKHLCKATKILWNTWIDGFVWQSFFYFNYPI